MQTKKRAKPVKFGVKAKEAEEKKVTVEAEAPAEHSAATAAPEPEEVEQRAEAEEKPAAHHEGGELVDKLSDVPFETDFGAPSTDSEKPAAHPTHEASEPEPVSFTATSTNPAEPAEDESAKSELQPSVTPPSDTGGQSLPPIGRASEPIPFNPHETVFNTPPDSGEKKRNPFLYFLIVAFVAFLTGIAFMAGIYYAMPDKNFFAMPSMPSVPAIPGISQPTATPEPVAKATATPVPAVKLSDYSIKVLNGSGVSGQAAKVKAALEAEGFTVASTGNAATNDVPKTQVTYKKTVSKEALTKVVNVLKASYVLDKQTELPSTATAEPDITITIGKETAK